MAKDNKQLKGSIRRLKDAKRRCNILLIDDFYSTGETANECVSVLKSDSLINKVYYLAMPKQNNFERSETTVKIFIAGARSVKDLGASVQRKMHSIFQKGFDVLVGDCYGVDASVQKFYANLGYNKVVVYASNGKARNNLGHWNIRAVSVTDNVRGFDFFKQKDIAMANEADYGFMIWDGESRGTLNNVINLVAQNKTVLIYLTTKDKMFVIKTIEDLNTLVGLCVPKTKAVYSKLLQDSVPQTDSQLSFTL